MKKILLLMFLVLLSCIGLSYAGPEGIAYTTTVALGLGIDANTVNISTSMSKIFIERITITAQPSLTNDQIVTFYDNGYGQLVLTSTTNAAANPIYQVLIATVQASQYAPIIIQESYSESLPLKARYGLYIRKSTLADVRVSILYR